MASHLNTAPRHKSKISMAARAHMFVCAGVLFVVIYVPSCVCVFCCVFCIAQELLRAVCAYWISDRLVYYSSPDGE